MERLHTALDLLCIVVRHDKRMSVGPNKIHLQVSMMESCMYGSAKVHGTMSYHDRYSGEMGAVARDKQAAKEACMYGQVHDFMKLSALMSPKTWIVIAC